MLVSLFAFAMFGAIEPNSVGSNNNMVENSFSGRPEARIAFENLVNNFTVKRENGDDILYLEVRMGNWYRAPLTCFGIGDPRDAMSMQPIVAGFGIDRFTRFNLIGLGHENSNECIINSLVELTPQETVTLGLESQKTVDRRLARRQNQQN